MRQFWGMFHPVANWPNIVLPAGQVQPTQHTALRVSFAYLHVGHICKLGFSAWVSHDHISDLQ